MRGGTRTFGSTSAILAALLLSTALFAAWPKRGLAWTPTHRIRAGSTCSPTGDFTTGGGWLLPGARAKRTFALSAELGAVPPLGRLLFVNHISDERLKAEVLTYVVTLSDTRVMTGTGTANGQPATFELEVSDAGEPGRGDRFDLLYVTATQVRREMGTLGGGNIQVHPMCGLP